MRMSDVAKLAGLGMGSGARVMDATVKLSDRHRWRNELFHRIVIFLSLSAEGAAAGDQDEYRLQEESFVPIQT